MIRRLVFDDDDKSRQRFKRLYEGLLLGGNDRKNIETIRREARVLDALDAISEKEQTVQGEQRKLVAPATLELQQADFALLEQYVNNTAWLPVVSRQIVDLVDWLSTAEKVETPKEPAKKE